MFKHLFLVFRKFKSNHVPVALDPSGAIHVSDSANSLIIIKVAVKSNVCLMTVTCKLHGTTKSCRNSANHLPLFYGTLKFIPMFTRARHWSLPKATRTNHPTSLRKEKFWETLVKKPKGDLMYSRDFLPPHWCNFHDSFSPLQSYCLTERSAENSYNLTPHGAWGRKYSTWTV
jgi:hypothetical protein